MPKLSRAPRPTRTTEVVVSASPSTIGIVSDLVKKHGVQTVLAGVLLYFMLGVINAKLESIEGTLRDTRTDVATRVAAIEGKVSTHETNADKLGASIVQHLQAEQDQGWMLISTMQQVCLRLAKTDVERSACVNIQPIRGR